jgi:hypothetical protein
MTQSAGAIWDIPLATVLIDDAGTITVTDTREYTAYTTAWPANIIAAGMYEAGAVTADKIPDRTRYELKGSGQLEPDATNPCAWTVGGSYDYWQFADAVTDSCWVYFMGPLDMASAQLSLYVWSVPDVNGAGAGAENCEWDYNIYYGADGGALTNTTGTVSVDQQARVNTTVYRDQVPAAALAVSEGQIVAFQLSRDGVADSYNSAMRLLGIEASWTSEA